MALSLAAATLGAGALGALGGITGSAMSASSSKALTKMQINWERERAKNAHQWEVKDLREAGLNPILSAGGSGANTGGISPVQPDYSGISNAGDIIAGIPKQLSEIKNLGTQSDLNSASTLKTEKEAGVVEPKANAEIKKITSATAVDRAQEQYLRAQRNLVIEQTRTEAVKDMVKKQLRNKHSSSAKQMKKDTDFLNNTKDEKQFRRAMLLGFENI